MTDWNNNPESAVYVAKYIVSRCYKLGSPISNLHLQYILYFAQKECLKNGCLAFYDEIEAWKFGPCVPSAYYRFCGFGAMPINYEYKNAMIDGKRKEIIDGVIAWAIPMFQIERCGELHQHACSPNEAWAKVYIKGIPDRDAPEIPTYLIKNR